MKSFDLLKAPLAGINLIEAGAGTGKTYNIEGLFVRLILEAQLQVEQILVHEISRRIVAGYRKYLTLTNPMLAMKEFVRYLSAAEDLPVKVSIMITPAVFSPAAGPNHELLDLNLEL